MAMRIQNLASHIMKALNKELRTFMMQIQSRQQICLPNHEHAQDSANCFHDVDSQWQIAHHQHEYT
jgi:hypothetical protein